VDTKLLRILSSCSFKSLGNSGMEAYVDSKKLNEKWWILGEF